MKKTCVWLLVIAMVLAFGGTCFADSLYCRNCGKSIPADSHFCLYCGTEVIRVADQSGGKAEKPVVTERSHTITVSDNQGKPVWICDTETNMMYGHPTLELYSPNHLHNKEIMLYLFQFCLPEAATEETLRNSARDSSEALIDWFDVRLGGENRSFSRTGYDGGFILILHSDYTLTEERYPFYGTVFCSPAYEDVELFWNGPFGSSEEAMEALKGNYVAGYPVKTADGKFSCLSVYCGDGNEWMKVQKSPSSSASSTEVKRSVNINWQNWSDYFDVVEDVEDTSLLIDGAGIYSCNLHTRLRLKDRFASKIDAARNNEVEFVVQYKECMGLFRFHFNGAGSITSVTDPDSFSTVKVATRAEYSYRFPEENSISGIPVQSILSGDPSGGAIGFANRYVEVLSASGTLYFK